jgi:non-ribosomal peptide synthetase component F
VQQAIDAVRVHSLCRYGVTTASAVPSQVQVLAREILSSHSSADAAADKAPGASLRRVLSGGEALTTTMAREVAAALPACELHNTYGPTETTVGESMDTTRTPLWS